MTRLSPPAGPNPNQVPGLAAPPHGGLPDGGGWAKLRVAGYVLLAAALLAPAVWRLAVPSAALAAAPGEVVIRYMAWGNPAQLQVERESIRLFNEKSRREGKNIRVELFMPPAGGYEQKLRLMLASGTAPDVMRADHYYFPSLVPKGYFRDLTGLAANDPEFDRADFHPSAMAENIYQDRLYGLNVLYGGIICYYNKDLFLRAGLPDPYEQWKRGEWTWDAFEHAAAALTERDASGDPIRYGFVMPGFGGGGIPPFAWAIWIWGEGGDLLGDDYARCLMDSPEAIAGLQRLRDLRFEKRVAPTQADAAASAFTFASGKVAMEFNFAGQSPRFRDSIRDFQWDIVPTPYNPEIAFARLTPEGPRIMESDGAGGERVHQHQLNKGNQLVMTAACAHPREAWEWMKFMVGRENELLLHGDELRRGVPTRLDVLEGQEYLQASRPPFHTDAFQFMLDHAKELPIDPTWPVWTTEIQQFIDTVFLNEDASVEQVMTRAAEATDRVLEREHERMSRYLGRGAE